MSRRAATRGSVSLGVVAAMLVAAVPVLLGRGELPAAVDVLNRTAWLASEAPGHIVRVSADTGRPDARVELGDDVGSFDVIQPADGDGVFVEVAGQVRAIDPSTLSWGASLAADGARFVAGQKWGFLLGVGTGLKIVDPASMAVVDEVDLAGRPGRAVVSSTDHLIVPIEGGRVQAVVDGVVGEPVTIGGDGIASIGAVGDSVVALTSDGLLAVLGADGSVLRSFDVGISAADAVMPDRVGGGIAWFLVPGRGEMVGVHTGSGDTTRIDLGTDGHRLTGPAVVGSRGYVVDRDAGVLIEVDVRAGSVEHRAELDVDDARKVSLSVRGDAVFVNDPASELALVIVDGVITPLDKYTDEGVTVTEPIEPPDEPEDEEPATEDEAQDEPEAPSTPTAPTAPATPPATPAGGSSPTTTEPPAPEAPGAVSAVSALPGNRSATISWAAPASGGAPTHYEVRRAGATQPALVNAPDLGVVVDGLRNGETYEFFVRAVNDVGRGPEVAAPPVTPTSATPAAVEDVTAFGGNQVATVSWPALPDADIASYIVTPTADSSSVTATPVEVDAEGGDQVSAEVALTPGYEWSFTVAARNDAGAVGEPSPESEPVLVVGPPGPIGSLAPSIGDQRVDLAWGEADDRRSGTVSYEVVASPGGATQTVTDAASSFTGLQNGVSYSFTITPFNDHGRGAPTEVAARPGRAPVVTGVGVAFTGDPRSNSAFRVTPQVDDGGRTASCQVLPVNLATGQQGAAIDSPTCGPVDVDTAYLATSYRFQVMATNELGSSAWASADAAAPAKRITLTSDRLRAEDGFIPGGNVARWSDPYPPDNIAGYVPNHTDVDAVCYIDDGAWSSDANGDYQIWVQLSDGLWAAASVIDSGPAVVNELRRC